MSKRKRKRTERNNRITLTLLASSAVFFIIFIAIMIAIGLIYLLMELGVIFSLQEDFELWQILLFLAAISMIIGFGLTALLSKIPLKPITLFITQINRLASGDFRARLDFGRLVRSFRPLQQLQDSFNLMAEELGNTEMLRSDFINNFSHEFKTPIVSIAGFAKLLKRGNLTEQQRLEYLDIIEEESLRLATMATNVLNMTKVENQGILSEVTTFNLSEQIRNCILMLEVKWSKKNIDFNIDFSEHTVTGGEELLMQLWINLIDNAIKFSPDEGTIGIDISETADRIAVSVTSSSSIPTDQLHLIFNKFYQADESHSSEGSGIGLALVKRITQLHGGAVTVESGSATTFTVTLPKKAN